jgi:vacuolar protein sorting-associated protein 18
MTYRGFGMRQQAVELALKVDPSLARELAQDSVDLEERKRLWLMIAKNAAFEGVQAGDVDVVSNVVSVLKDCGPDVLSIEDVSRYGNVLIQGCFISSC